MKILLRQNFLKLSISSRASISKELALARSALSEASSREADLIAKGRSLSAEAEGLRQEAAALKKRLEAAKTAEAGLNKNTKEDIRDASRKIIN